MVFAIHNSSVFFNAKHIHNSKQQLKHNLNSKLKLASNKKCIENHKTKECIILWDEIEELSSALHKLMEENEP